MSSLDRFLEAQSGGVYEQALAELQAGRKTTHWMWFVFPQIAGLGRSETARYYAIESLGEARAYLAHPVLGFRLNACVAALLTHRGRTAIEIMGGIDATKLRSSLTLFQAAGAGPAFTEALGAFFTGPDPETLRLLGSG